MRHSAERDAVVAHLAQRVGEVGVPVAVAPVDGQVEAGAGEVGPQRVEERAVLLR